VLKEEEEERKCKIEEENVNLRKMGGMGNMLKIKYQKL
jgi:hypothetical protein